MSSSASASRAQFEDLLLDLASGELSRGERRVRLQSQPFLILRTLLECPGEVVSREDLQSRLWPEKSFGDFDHGLNKAVAKLREAFGELGSDSAIIETLPRRGYRLTATVSWSNGGHGAAPAPSTEKHVSRRLVPGFAVGALTAVALTAVALAAAVWIGFRFNRGANSGTPDIRSIAVLPLENLSNDPEQDYFADGITDELITDLSYARSLRVISRASSSTFKITRLTVPEIADKLRVDGIIEGTVRKVDQRVQISIRLLAANPERQIWTATYEGELSDTLALQNRIAAEAVKQICGKLPTEEQAQLSARVAPINPEAHDEYLRARFFLDEETGQEGKAIPHLERAVQLDPEYAAAYAALGEAWGQEGVWGINGNREASAKALTFSLKAVSLDPNSSQAYASLGHSLMQSHRWNEGETALRRAVALDPNNLYAQSYLALVLMQKGNLEESVAIGRELAAANPVSPYALRTYANMLYRARHYDEAIAQCLSILEIDPNHLATYTTLANALVEKGRYEEAREAFVRGELMDPGVEAWLDVRAGDPQRARRALAAQPKLVNVHTSVARYLLGDKERGLAELDYLTNETWAVKTYHLRNDPTFDPMRNDSRFLEIVKRSGLLDN